MTVRDDTRAAQAAQNALAKQQGLNLEDLRKETRNSIALGAQITELTNSSTPTQGRARTKLEDFAGQVFNGTNDAYTLSQRVFGENIHVVHIVQATGTAQELARGSNPAPSGASFYFDGFFTVRVGVAPLTLDGLLAFYLTPL
jgi:hypothetical protein